MDTYLILGTLMLVYSTALCILEINDCGSKKFNKNMKKAADLYD